MSFASLFLVSIAAGFVGAMSGMGGGVVLVPAMTLLENVVGYVLLGGVLLSVALVVAGLAWHWLRTGQLGVQYTLSASNLFQFLVAEVGEVVAGRFRPRLLVSLGIAALLLTPYLRVLASLVLFALFERNAK
jgi:hypothetical protein